MTIGSKTVDCVHVRIWPRILSSLILFFLSAFNLMSPPARSHHCARCQSVFSFVIFFILSTRLSFRASWITRPACFCWFSPFSPPPPVFLLQDCFWYVVLFCPSNRFYLPNLAHSSSSSQHPHLDSLLPASRLCSSFFCRQQHFCGFVFRHTFLHRKCKLSFLASCIGFNLFLKAIVGFWLCWGWEKSFSFIDQPKTFHPPSHGDKTWRERERERERERAKNKENCTPSRFYVGVFDFDLSCVWPWMAVCGFVCVCNTLSARRVHPLLLLLRRRHCNSLCKFFFFQIWVQSFLKNLCFFNRVFSFLSSRLSSSGFASLFVSFCFSISSFFS